MDRDEPPVAWLLNSTDPSIRYFTLVELLDESTGSAEVRKAREKIPEGPRFRALLDGQRGSDELPRRASSKGNLKFSAQRGGFGVHPYQKWTGAHWRLVSLVELGLPSGHRRGIAAAEQVLRWLWGESHRMSIKRTNGLARRCASQEGNALAVCSRLGLADDERVGGLAESLIEWQWPDGGWNCDKRPEADHSSFYESLAPLWGLFEYHRAIGDPECLKAAQHATELFLRHRLFRSENAGQVINNEWLKFHYPLYWHYDILQGLRILSLVDGLNDPRAQEALDVLEQKRDPHGLWRVEGCYWAPVGRRKSNVDVVDWGREGPNEMITLNALRVLKTAGRIR